MSEHISTTSMENNWNYEPLSYYIKSYDNIHKEMYFTINFSYYINNKKEVAQNYRPVIIKNKYEKYKIILDDTFIEIKSNNLLFNTKSILNNRLYRKATQHDFDK